MRHDRIRTRDPRCAFHNVAMPDRVLSAASTQLCLVGADALTVESIAERAHVSVGFIYKKYHSLSELVHRAIDEELPSALDVIPDRQMLPIELLAPTSRVTERLPLEAILATRRFPELREPVGVYMSELTSRVGPLRCSVILGCQALGIAGVDIEIADMASLISLESRIQSGACNEDTVIAAPIDIGASTVPHPGPERRDPTAERLRDAASELLTETAGRASLRDIASRAGVTTGAVYRRYDSKDELIGDTINARVNEERTNWIQEFLKAWVDPTHGDPGRVLAQVLAEVSTANQPQTREAIELLVAARSGPAARSALSQRYLDAAKTRKAQFEPFSESGLMKHSDSPAALAWAVQVGPMGTRVATLVTSMPDAEGWYPSMVAMLRAL